MKKIIVFMAFLAFFYQSVSAEVKLSLSECENAALNYSRNLKSLENEVKSLESSAKSAQTQNYPSLVLEGTLKYITDVPEFNGMEFGDNWNYSIGPAIYWTAFDGNVKNKNYKSLLKAAQAKKLEYENAKKQTLLSVRTAYFKLISSLTTLDLLNRQLNLALSQNGDVLRSIKAGIKTNLDGVLSDTDVLKKQNQIRDAQLAVIDNLNALNDLTGGTVSFDVTGNIEINDWNKLFSYDLPEAVLEDFIIYKSAEFDSLNPAALSLETLSQYYEMLSEISINSNYPVINIYAKTSLDHPNGPVVETYNQNTFGASFSMPLYQFGKNKKSAEEKKYTSKSYEERKLEILENLRRLFDYSKYKVEVLDRQRVLNSEIITQTKTAAELMYKSYMAGESKYLDVETLNFRVIEAQTNGVNTYAQMLIQLAIIASVAQ